MKILSLIGAACIALMSAASSASASTTVPPTWPKPLGEDVIVSANIGGLIYSVKAEWYSPAADPSAGHDWHRVWYEVTDPLNPQAGVIEVSPSNFYGPVYRPGWTPIWNKDFEYEIRDHIVVMAHHFIVVLHVKAQYDSYVAPVPATQACWTALPSDLYLQPPAGGYDREGWFFITQEDAMGNPCSYLKFYGWTYTLENFPPNSTTPPTNLPNVPDFPWRDEAVVPLFWDIDMDPWTPGVQKDPNPSGGVPSLPVPNTLWPSGYSPTAPFPLGPMSQSGPPASPFIY